MTAIDPRVRRNPDDKEIPTLSAEDDSSSRQPHPLRHILARGAAWTLAGNLCSHGLRLTSNLILTKLLYPEAFGIMALAFVFLQGLQMFSDTGLNITVVQNGKGDDQSFLNSVWSMQVLRGLFLWAMSWVIAVPAAQFYQQSILTWIIPLIGFSSFVDGFSSTKALLLNRHLHIGVLTAFQLSTQLVGVASTLAIVWFWPTVWALAIGSVISNLFKVACSHLLLRGTNNRFCLRKDHCKEILRFGKWIFLSTAIGFVATQFDKLFLGRVLSTEILGVYVIAFYFYQSIPMIMRMLGNNLTLPTYSLLVRKRSGQFLSRVRRLRRALLTIAFPPICCLAIFGSTLIEFLYDDRYHQAGWMLEMLSIDALMWTLCSTMVPMLLASGHSFRASVLMVFHAAIIVACLTIGWTVAGLYGVTVGIALSHFLLYPFLIYLIYDYGIWSPRLDAIAIGSALLVIGTAKYFYWGGLSFG